MYVYTCVCIYVCRDRLHQPMCVHRLRMVAILAQARFFKVLALMLVRPACNGAGCNSHQVNKRLEKQIEMEHLGHACDRSPRRRAGVKAHHDHHQPPLPPPTPPAPPASAAAAAAPAAAAAALNYLIWGIPLMTRATAVVMNKE